MIVIDMDMPRSCIECGCSDRNGCQVTNAVLSYKEMRGERPQNCPIKCDIEDIKEEIDGLLNDSDSALYQHGVLDALEIIDKHTKGDTDADSN